MTIMRVKLTNTGVIETATGIVTHVLEIPVLPGKDKRITAIAIQVNRPVDGTYERAGLFLQPVGMSQQSGLLIQGYVPGSGYFCGYFYNQVSWLATTPYWYFGCPPMNLKNTNEFGLRFEMIINTNNQTRPLEGWAIISLED